VLLYASALLVPSRGSPCDGRRRLSNCSSGQLSSDSLQPDSQSWLARPPLEDARGSCPGVGGVRGASGRVLGASWARPGVRRASWGRPAWTHAESSDRSRELRGCSGASRQAAPRQTRCRKVYVRGWIWGAGEVRPPGGSAGKRARVGRRPAEFGRGRGGQPRRNAPRSFATAAPRFFLGTSEHARVGRAMRSHRQRATATAVRVPLDANSCAGARACESVSAQGSQVLASPSVEAAEGLAPRARPRATEASLCLGFVSTWTSAARSASVARRQRQHASLGCPSPSTCVVTTRCSEGRW
jgi:hypothetical protein